MYYLPGISVACGLSTISVRRRRLLLNTENKYHKTFSPHFFMLLPRKFYHCVLWWRAVYTLFRRLLLKIDQHLRLSFTVLVPVFFFQHLPFFFYLFRRVLLEKFLPGNHSSKSTSFRVLRVSSINQFLVFLVKASMMCTKFFCFVLKNPLLCWLPSVC